MKIKFDYSYQTYTDHSITSTLSLKRKSKMKRKNSNITIEADHPQKDREVSPQPNWVHSYSSPSSARGSTRGLYKVGKTCDYHHDHDHDLDGHHDPPICQCILCGKHGNNSSAPSLHHPPSAGSGILHTCHRSAAASPWHPHRW